MQLFALLEQAGPELLLELLLTQDHLDVLAGVVDLALIGNDLGEQLELDLVVDVLQLRVAGEGDLGGLYIQRHLLLGHIRSRDGQEDVVALGIRCRRALGPEDCGGRVSMGHAEMQAKAGGQWPMTARLSGGAWRNASTAARARNATGLAGSRYLRESETATWLGGDGEAVVLRKPGGERAEMDVVMGWVVWSLQWCWSRQEAASGSCRGLAR